MSKRTTSGRTDPGHPAPPAPAGGAAAIQPERLYTVRELARLLGVGYSTLGRAVASGELPSVQITDKGRKRVRGQTVLDRLKVPPPPPDDDTPAARKKRAAGAAREAAAALRRTGRATRPA